MLRTARLLSSLAATALFCSFAIAQDAALEISGPAELLELAGSYVVQVDGAAINDATPSITVRDGETDITSQVTITLTGETREDGNSDGLLESYHGDFIISLEGYELVPGHQLATKVTASAPVGSIVRETSAAVTANVTVAISSGIAEDSNAVNVAVITERMVVADYDVTVYLGDVDVTSQVSLTGPLDRYEVTDSGTPPFVEYRIDGYQFDISSLEPEVGAVLSVNVQVTTPGSETTSDTGIAKIAPSYELTPCHKAALDAFIAVASNPSKTPDEIDAAAATLVEALGECSGTAFPYKQEVTYTTAGGTSIIITIGTAGGSASAAGSADLVVAIGGDADDPSSASGGNATATNKQKGGIAIAIGGNGGSNASSGGNGGAATAIATPGTNGSGLAVASGGNGGDPINNALAGGRGGSATARCGGASYTAPGSPGAAGTPGTHGGGGWWSQGPFGGSNGTRLPTPNV